MKRASIIIQETGDNKIKVLEFKDFASWNEVYKVSEELLRLYEKGMHMYKINNCIVIHHSEGKTVVGIGHIISKEELNGIVAMAKQCGTRLSECRKAVSEYKTSEVFI